MSSVPVSTAATWLSFYFWSITFTRTYFPAQLVGGFFRRLSECFSGQAVRGHRYRSLPLLVMYLGFYRAWGSFNVPTAR